MGKWTTPGWRRTVCTTVAFLVAAALAAEPQNTFSILGQLEGPFAVERVIDGDTFVLDGGERVRIIGVDAPEVGEPFADRATAFLAALIKDKPIFLELDAGERDRFGRLLAYVYVEDPGGAWVAENGRRFTQASHALAAAGLADIMTVPPNVTYAEVHLDAVRAARDTGRGFWRPWECVDINAAPLERLMEVVHIDAVRGQELMRLRPFASINDLRHIDGIGPARLAGIIEQGIVCPID
jgi:endonuclease YncB( thermonuclease family)